MALFELAYEILKEYDKDAAVQAITGMGFDFIRSESPTVTKLILFVSKERTPYAEGKSLADAVLAKLPSETVLIGCRQAVAVSDMHEDDMNELLEELERGATSV